MGFNSAFKGLVQGLPFVLQSEKYSNNKYNLTQV